MSLAPKLNTQQAVPKTRKVEQGTAKVAGESGNSFRLEYTGRVSTFKRDFGAAVEAKLITVGDEQIHNEATRALNEFVVRKHRELEVKFAQALEQENS